MALASNSQSSRRPRCLVPGFDGALFSPAWRDALWAKFFMAAPLRQRTVAKWRKRSFVADLPTGPKQPSSTVLSIEEAIVVAFRRQTLLPLDDCLYALQPTKLAPG